MPGTILKAIGVWLVMLMAAIANGALRENILTPALGAARALPVSGLLLTLFIFLIVFGAIPLFRSSAGKGYWGLGLLWCGLTLAFEFLFGRFAAGKSWPEIIAVFNLQEGNLFALVLLATLVAPGLAAKLRGLSQG